ncbi:carboxypeptidase-like regulatory domain-containing protein [Actinoplanes aureus]|uniref:Carboxypeptidase regulatory-like domain-containing protein n=1 Tax=Actinoplanes aureus TaxID=2792083 RepID=A0A931C8F9_9ACTN|nr:carboxypeptidase-like regulatory domain-containing protein [Actinoplanes aureus]MBG0562851.1 carboxypeptidase regulatory-like domain-containing protein [Actinoplanes aureus]
MISVSGGWFVLWDEFHRERYTGPIGVTLDRWAGDEWVPDESRPLITLGRVLTYPGLGRRRRPWTAPDTMYRIRVEAPGRRALYPRDRPEYETNFDATDDAREFVVPHYDDRTRPAPGEGPDILRLVPGVTFAYPPGTRVIRGVVRLPDGAGIPGALVVARTPKVADYGDWAERTLTDANGEFRLSLRWRGTVEEPDSPRPQPETFTVGAYRALGRSGTVEVRWDPEHPAEPTTYVIQIGD